MVSLDKRGRKHRQRGLFLVLLGPDGAGKSTLLAAATSRLEARFSGIWRFHWRPGLLPKLGSVSNGQDAATAPSAPPVQAAYGPFISLVRYCYYLLDFLLGYWFGIKPRVDRGILVIGERWYFDVIVSPQRYGFALPRWLLKMGGALVPRPDITILLKADAEAIHRRKPELSVDQIKTQMAQMEEFIGAGRDRYTVDTGGALDTAVESLSTLVHNAATSATSATRQHPRWLAFPNPDNPKIWVDGREDFAHALNLYHPYSRAGSIAKAFIAVMPNNLCRLLYRAAPTHEQTRHLVELNDKICQTLGNELLAISYATGTPGPHRKLTAQVSLDRDIITYVKISSNPLARKLLEHEASVLKELRIMQLEGIYFPELITDKDYCDYHMIFTSAPSSPGNQRGLDSDEADAHFLTTLIRHGFREYSITQALDTLESKSVLAQARRQQPNAVEVLQAVHELLYLRFDGRGVVTTFAHGDYAPWNTLQLACGILYVFDWEYAREGLPVLTDLCHRVFMPLRLVRGLDPAAAVTALVDVACDRVLRPVVEAAGLGKADMPDYILLYLLMIAARETQSGKGVVTDYVLDCMRKVIEMSDTDSLQL